MCVLLLMCYVVMNEDIVNLLLSKIAQEKKIYIYIHKSLLQNHRPKFQVSSFSIKRPPTTPQILKRYSTVSRKEKSLLWKNKRTSIWNSLKKNYREILNRALGKFKKPRRKGLESTWTPQSTKLQLWCWMRIWHHR